MINIQNNAVKLSNNCGNLILPNGKIFYWYEQTALTGSALGYAPIYGVVCNTDGSIAYGPTLLMTPKTQWANNAAASNWWINAQIISGNIFLSRPMFTSNSNIYDGCNHLEYIICDYTLNILRNVSNSTYVYIQQPGISWPDFKNANYPSWCWNTGFTNQYMLHTTGKSTASGDGTRWFMSVTVLGLSPWTVSQQTVSGLDASSGFIGDIVAGYGHHTVGQLISGTRATTAITGLLLFMNNSITRTVLTTLNASIVANPANVAIVKGYNEQIYVIYKVSDNSIRYRNWYTVTNTFGTEVTLKVAGSQTGNMISTTASCVSQAKINTSDILVAIGCSTGFGCVQLTQNLTNNLLMVVADRNISGFAEDDNKGVFLGKGTNLVEFATTLPNIYSTVDTSSWNRSSNQHIPTSGDTSVNDQFRVPVREYSFNQGVYKQQEEHSMDSSGNIYSAIRATIGPAGVDNCGFQKLTISTSSYTTSTLTTINFTTTGMTSFKFEPTQSTPAGTSIQWSYSVNNGSSYTNLNAGDTIVVTSNKLKLKAVLTPTASATPIISEYKVTVYK